MTSAHDRIITPGNSPDRFTEEEAALFRAGKCVGVTGYGTGSGIVYCERPSKPGASFGHCELHDADMLTDYFPDGTPRRNADPRYQERPDYQMRLDAAAAAWDRAGQARS